MLCAVGLLFCSGLIQLQYYDSRNVVLQPEPLEQYETVLEAGADQSVVTIDLYQLEQQVEEQGA